MITRRTAIILLGAIAQTSTPQALTISQPTAPSHLTIDLDLWSDWTIRYHGQSVCVTADEIFGALREATT